jgi:hypothetical protein
MKTLAYVACLLGLVASLPALAVDVSKGGGTMTRFVLQFGQLERAMQDAQAKHDQKQLDAMLSPLFEIRRASGDRVMREDWLKAAGSAPAAQSAPNQLAVYEVGQTAVANYWLGQPGSKDAVFIVDVWVPEGDKWLLRARFESPGH